MTAFNEIAPAFVEMAHNIVWCTTATVDAKRRPRSRVLHPLWQWEGETLTRWIATIRRRDDSGMGKRQISPFCGVKTRSLAASSHAGISHDRRQSRSQAHLAGIVGLDPSN